MSGVVFLLLDLGEWLGKLFVSMVDDPQILVGTACVLFLILVVMAGALGMGAQV